MKEGNLDAEPQLQAIGNEGVVDSEAAQLDAVVRDLDTQCTDSEFELNRGICGFKFRRLQRTAVFYQQGDSTVRLNSFGSVPDFLGIHTVARLRDWGGLERCPLTLSRQFQCDCVLVVLRRTSPCLPRLEGGRNSDLVGDYIRQLRSLQLLRFLWNQT